MRAPCPFDAVDVFAGPGGWSEAMRALGLREVGVEWDHTACQTAVAAGHARVRADVRTLPLEPFLGIRGLIASPPCPTFSAAGSGTGRHDLPLVLAAIKRMGAGEWPTEELAACDDDRTALTVEPLRWALYLRPEWTTWEQVPAVLPVWEACAEVLRAEGYSVWTGNLQAEEYGVPQTRKRAVLIASRMREVTKPTPTHTRYRKGKPRQADGLLPWVSMEDALGWGATVRPGMTVTGGGTATGGAEPFGNAARQGLQAEQAAGRWVQRSNYSDGAGGSGTAAERGRTTRELTEPAVTVTSKGHQWSVAMGDVRQANGTIRDSDEPAATLTASMDNGNHQWHLRNGTGAHAAVRPADEPAPTVHFGARLNTVTWEEPPAVMAGAGTSCTTTPPRAVGEPAQTITGAGSAEWGQRPGPAAARGQRDPQGVRVTPEEAAVLQSFPADYPWQGTRTKVFQQIGNAVPPLLALAVIEAAL